jgi:hypothetical protein
MTRIESRLLSAAADEDLSDGILVWHFTLDSTFYPIGLGRAVSPDSPADGVVVYFTGGDDDTGTTTDWPIVRVSLTTDDGRQQASNMLAGRAFGCWGRFDGPTGPELAGYLQTLPPPPSTELPSLPADPGAEPPPGAGDPAPLPGA